MATQMEVTSTLPSLFTSRSQKDSKAAEQPGPLALLILEDQKQREALMRAATAPPAPLRARLTPKPFSREKTSDSFAVVKPPIPSARPSSDLPEPSAFAQTLREAVKRPAGKIPPLLDQSSSGHENPRECVANVVFPLSLQANPVILFEGRSSEKAKMEGTPEAGGFLKAPEGPLLYSRPFSWNPLGKRDASLSAPEGSMGNSEEQQGLALASKTQREPRGLSAFLEVGKGSTEPAPPAQKPACEKSWLRNPRPLSTDLTARFENQHRGKSLSAVLADADSSGPGGKSTAQQAEPSCEEGQTAPHPSSSPAREATPLCQSPPEDPGEIPTKERKALGERQHQGSLNSLEGDAGAKELLAHRGQALGERAQVMAGSTTDTPEVKTVSFESGGMKKTSPVLAAAAGAPAPVGSEAFPEGHAKERRATHIQQRIKELTAENTDFKPGNSGRSFRSRPLSADLTKRFSGPATASGQKPQPLMDRKPDREMQEAPEDQAQPLCGTDSRKACRSGPPGNPQLLVKISSKEGSPEGKSSAANSRLKASLQGEPLTLSLSAEATRRSLQPPEEEACIKTVRATIFEHSVQRHHVVAEHLAAEPPLPNEFPGETLAWSRGLFLDKVPGTAPSAKGSIHEAIVEPTDPKPVPEQKGSPAGAKIPSREKGDDAVPAKDSLLDQRIEPRYEILQMVGERAQSEAVGAVHEEKAITLRRGKSLRERRRSGSGSAAGSQPCDVGSKRGGWREDPKPVPDTNPWKGLPASSSQPGSHWQELGQGRDWSACVKAALSNRTKESRQMDGRVSLETEPGERGGPAGRNKEAHLLDRFPDQAGFGPHRTKIQWPRLGHSSKGPEPAYEPEEPQGCGRKTCSPTHGAEGTGSSSGRLTGGLQFQPLEVEEQRKRCSANGSALRVSERWRRRTVPHKAAGPEEVQEPSPNSARPVSRRDSWHLSDGSAAHRSPQAQRRVNAQQAGAISPSRLRKQQLCPLEAKATYFAVTYQASSEIDEVPEKAALGSPNMSNSRRADHSDLEGFLARPPGWSRGGLPGKGASEYPPREEAWELPGRQARLDRGQTVAEDPPLSAAPRSSSRLVPLRQEIKLAGKPRSSPSPPGGAEEQPAASYRPRAVDIDELMAEYGVDSKEESGKEHRRLEESRLLSGCPLSHICSLSETRRTEPSPGSKRPGTASGSNGGLPQGCDGESGPWAARDGKFNPPCWARPVGPTNKTFFPSQEQRESFGPGLQRAKDAASRPLDAHPVQMDLGPEASPSSEGGLWKDTSPRWPATLALAQGQRPSRALNSGTEGKSSVPRRAWEKGSSVAQGRAGQDSTVPGSVEALATPFVKGSACLGPEGRLRPDWHPVHQSSMVARPEAQLIKDHRIPGCPSPDRQGDFEWRRPKQASEDTGAGRAPSLLKQRRSHSFYRERRTDHWPGEQLKQCLGRSPAEAAGNSEVLLQEAESLAPETSSTESSPAHTQLQPPSSSSSSLAGRVFADDQQGSTKGQRSASPIRSSQGGDSAEGTKASLPVGGALDFAFLEQTPVLDSGALKSRALLSKRRRQPRAPSSHLLRKSPAGAADPLLEEAVSPWMFKDSTDPKSTEGEDSGRDERSVPAERLSSSQTPRQPVFPGVDPSAIKAQLRKRRESEGGEEVLPEPLSKSPKGPLQAGAGGRGLGTAPEKGGRLPEPRSPQWLQELKSKKKQSQAERPV